MFIFKVLLVSVSGVTPYCVWIALAEEERATLVVVCFACHFECGRKRVQYMHAGCWCWCWIVGWIDSASDAPAGNAYAWWSARWCAERT